MNENETRKASESPANAKGEIVVYQPDETMRLEVRLANETVWLSQDQMIALFERDRSVISRHIRNAFAEGEVDEATCLHFLQTNRRGRPEAFYSLDVVISVGYRVKSIRGTLFRRWATNVLRDYFLRGVAVLPAPREALAAEMDRRFASHERRIAAVEERIDFVVRSALPAPEMVFCEGEFLSAHDAIRKIVRSARRRLVLVDNFIDERVLTLLAERRKGVTCRVYGRNAASRDVRLAYERFRQQYPNDSLRLVPLDKAHDRFIVCDDVAWLCGASVKDAGRRMFALVKMATSPDFILRELPKMDVGIM